MENKNDFFYENLIIFVVVPKSGLIPALSRNGNNAEAYEPGRVHLKTNILEVRTSSLLDTQSASCLLPERRVSNENI